MKVYAKQINPEYQESYLFDDDGMGTEYINVCGNKDFQSRTSKLFDRVKECLDNGELAEAIEDIKTGGYYSSFYENVTQAINDLLWREDGKPYGTRQKGGFKMFPVIEKVMSWTIPLNGNKRKFPYAMLLVNDGKWRWKNEG